MERPDRKGKKINMGQRETPLRTASGLVVGRVYQLGGVDALYKGMTALPGCDEKLARFLVGPDNGRGAISIRTVYVPQDAVLVRGSQVEFQVNAEEGAISWYDYQGNSGLSSSFGAGRFESLSEEIRRAKRAA